MATSVLNPDYEALRAAQISSDPFPHLVVENFIHSADLERLFPVLPDISSGGSWPPEALNLSPLVADLVHQMQGEKLRKLIAEKFDLQIASAPTMLTMRGQTREKDGRIHCDSVSKLVTVLLYLNPPSAAFGRQEGCLRLLRGPDDVEDYAIEVPPINGTLLIFPNGPTTWHGHRQYVGPRYTIQLNYMAKDSRARIELARHKLSALAKRLPFVA